MSLRRLRDSRRMGSHLMMRKECSKRRGRGRRVCGRRSRGLKGSSSRQREER
jgi:hypothetical protein